MELFRLMGSIFVDSDAAEESIAQTEEKANNLGSSLGKGIKTAAKWGAGLAAGAGVAIGGMAGLIGKTLETTAEISKFAQVTGMSNKGFQEWDSVMKKFGFSAEAAAGDIAALAEKAMDAQAGGEENAAIFKELGVSVEDSSGKLKTQEQLFNDTIKGLQGMEDVTRRNAIATAFLSTTGEELAPVLNMTNEELAKMKKGANVISDDQLAKAEEFRAGWGKVKTALGGVATEIGIGIMPAFQTVMDWVTGKMPDIQSIVETSMSLAGDAVAVVSSIITEKVIPKLDALYAWIEPNIPAIKQFFVDSFEVIQDLFEKLKDVVQVLSENMNILLPIIIGVTGAIVAQMIIDSLVKAYKAWRAATVAQTTVQWLLNAALNANPLGLVALAIGAVIAIGILLWKNWDTIKEKALQLGIFLLTKFIEIKDGVISKVKELASSALRFFVSLYTGALEKFNALKAGGAAIISALRNAIVNKIEEIRSNAVNKISSMKNSVVGKFDEVRSSAVTKFNAVKDAILRPVNLARDTVKRAVDKIKGFFTGMKLNLPNIKTPHFKLKNWSINPVDWLDARPSIGVEWYAKGGVFKKPTLFNTSSGLKGVGEAGPEAVLPLSSSVLGMIGQKISDTMHTAGNKVEIHVNGMTVREEADIYKIARELRRLMQQAERGEFA